METGGQPQLMLFRHHLPCLFFLNIYVGLGGHMHGDCKTTYQRFALFFHSGRWQRSNPGYQAWQHMPLPTGPSPQPVVLLEALA